MVVDHLTITDKDSVREAQRWTNGERGPLVDDPDLLGEADLTAFVVEAIRIGSHALSVTGQAQETKALERMLKERGREDRRLHREGGRRYRSRREGRLRGGQPCRREAKKAFTEADAQTRKELTEAVATTKQ